MALQTATPLNRWVKSAEERTLYAGRFNIGPRLILGFVFIILSMLAADAVVLWQFHLVRTQAERLNGIDQKLIAVLRVHTSLFAFHDRLEELADSQDVGRLVAEGGPLRTAVLEDTHRAISALSLPPFEPRRDPTILPTLHVLQSTLPSQLEAITTLATSGDWRAVHLRLANEVMPLESLTSAIVENVDHEVGEEQAQTVLNIKRVQRVVFVMVPLTALVTLLIAATLGVVITRSITQPLARLVDGSKALARGEFQYQVAVTGNDELAHVGRVFNDTARRLQDLYANLQRSEDRLRLVIDTIPAHVWSARPDGSVDFINQRFLESTGLSMEGLLGWGWDSVVHPDDLARFLDKWRVGLATGKPMESEVRIRRADGDYRSFLVRNVPLRDELGNIVNWYGTAIDIEERHRAEEALRRSEAYLAEAQRLSKTGSFGWNVSSGKILWSEETFRIFGYHRSTKPTIELIVQRVHPEDVSSFKETAARALRDGKDFEHEYRLLMPDGTVKYVHVVAHAGREESGEIEFVGAVMDVSDRKRAEEELRQSEALAEQRLRLVVDTTPAMINTCRADGYLDYVNKGWLDYFGLPLETALDRADVMKMSAPSNTDSYGGDWQPIIHPDDLQRFTDHWKATLASGQPAEQEGRVRRFDGMYRWHLFRAVPLHDESGKPVKWYVSAFDIEDRKQAEEALRRSEGYLAQGQRLTHSGSWAWNARTGVRFWSQETFRIFGCDPEKVRPTWSDILERTHPEDRAAIEQKAQQETTLKEDSEFDWRIVHPDGTIRYLHSIAHPVLDESGETTEIVGTLMDVTERLVAEDALRRSESYLAEAQRISRTGSWAGTPGPGPLRYWSEECFRLLGFDPHDGLPTAEAFYQRVHPDDLARMIELMARAAREKTGFEFDYRIVHPCGEVRDIHVIGHPAFSPSSKLVEYVGTVIDVTERKRAEETLRQSEAYLAEAQRLSHTGSWAWNLGSKQQFWSVETFRIFGFDPNTTAPTRENFLGRVHPDDRASIELVETELYKGSDAEYNYRVILPDGSIKYITSVAHSVCNDSGQVIEFVGTVMDVTERKLAEALRDGESRILEMIARDAPLKETLEKLVLLVEAQFADLICSVLLLDEDGQHMHPGAAPNLPTDYTQAIDGMCIGPKAGSSGTAMYRREPVVVTDILQDPLWESYRDAAEPYGLRACWSIPILAHSGEPLGSFTMYYPEPRGPSPDETRALEMATHLAGIAIERKLAREERERLRQVQAELAHVSRVTTMGELTVSLAHELNQPIAAAITNANTCMRWLAADIPGVDEARAAAMRAVKDGTRAAEIIKRIRLLFKKGTAQRELVDVNEIVGDMVFLLRSEATQYSIKVRTELKADLPEVVGDRVQLQQVLMNLMINGIEAMKDVEGTRELVVKSERGEGDQILVSVSDNGVGLPPQHKEQIFNAFFTTKPHGTGMGLRISRSIIESHGGRLWAADNSPRGATFCFTLPTKAEAND